MEEAQPKPARRLRKGFTVEEMPPAKKSRMVHRVINFVDKRSKYVWLDRACQSTGINRVYLIMVGLVLALAAIIAGCKLFPISNIFIFLWPLPSTVHLVTAPDASAPVLRQSLIFWVVVAFFLWIESLLDATTGWIPLTWTIIKMSFLGLLFWRKELGANLVFSKVIEPMVRAYEDAVPDRTRRKEWAAEALAALTAVTHIGSAGEAVAAVTAALPPGTTQIATQMATQVATQVATQILATSVAAPVLTAEPAPVSPAAAAAAPEPASSQAQS